MMNIVGELSSLVLAFKLNIPIDKGCLFRVFFPADQPITDELVSVTGQGIFSQTTSFSVLDKTNNYIEVRGCTQYTEMKEIPATFSIAVSQILNIGWQKDTLPFKY